MFEEFIHFANFLATIPITYINWVLRLNFFRKYTEFHYSVTSFTDWSHETSIGYKEFFPVDVSGSHNCTVAFLWDR